jgi:hypothetical protein
VVVNNNIIDGVYTGPRKYTAHSIVVGSDPSLISLGSIEEVVGDLSLHNCPNLVSLGNLRTVRGNLSIQGCPSLTSLGHLQEVLEGYVEIRKCPNLKTLGCLQKVEGAMFLEKMDGLTSLGSLRHVQGFFTVQAKILESLGTLRTVDGDLEINVCPNLRTLGELHRAGGVYIQKPNALTSLGHLTTVRNSLNMCTPLLSSLGQSLETIGGMLHLSDCHALMSLGGLRKVGEYVRVDGKKDLPWKKFQEQIAYYENQEIHEALNLLHEPNLPGLYKNILLRKIQGVPSTSC